MEQMVKSGLTPAHPHALEALLDEPLTRTLDHATPHRPTQVFVPCLVDMIPVPLPVPIPRRPRIPCGVRQALVRSGRDQVGPAPVRLAMPPPVPCPASPPTCPGGA